MKVSLIISTYNWPAALELVLRSICQQIQMPHEVIIADDGSKDETRELIEGFQEKMSCSLYHVWHEDKGFHLSMIRNKAVAKSNGDYLVLIDGDCVLRPHFIQRHTVLSNDNCFVAGNRVLLTEKFTRKVLAEKLNIEQWSALQFERNQVNQRWSLMTLPMTTAMRRCNNKWQGVKTCNLSMYKKDFDRVNGFDEDFIGWGYEDSDLVVRLLRKGLNKINGRFSTTVLHLWHPSSETKGNNNLQRFQETLRGGKVRSEADANRF